MNPFPRHEAREQELDRKGWQIIDTIDYDTHKSPLIKGKYPEGSVWIFTTGRVWAPPTSKGN